MGLLILKLGKMRYGEVDWLIDMAAGVWTVNFHLSFQLDTKLWFLPEVGRQVLKDDPNSLSVLVSDVASSLFAVDNAIIIMLDNGSPLSNMFSAWRSDTAICKCELKLICWYKFIVSLQDNFSQVSLHYFGGSLNQGEQEKAPPILQQGFTWGIVTLPF